MLSLAALLMLGAQPSSALGPWTPLGPHGGTILDLVVHSPSGTLYAGTKAGLFRSADGGAHWTVAGGNLPRSGPTRGIQVNAVAVDSGSPDTVYASVWLHGVFKSVDGGSGWTRADSGLVGPTEKLFAHPDRPGTVFAATSAGLFETGDGGAHWSELGALPTTAPYHTVYALALDPSSSEALYVGLVDQLLKTEDGGATWVRLGAAFLSGRIIDAIAVDPRPPHAVFASTFDFATGSSGLFRSADRGSTWSPASSGLPAKARITALAVPASGPVAVYAAVFESGVFKSVDGGAHWSAVDHSLQHVNQLVSDPAVSGGLYAAGVAIGSSGVFKSADGGASWTLRSAGISAAELRGIVVDPQIPSTLYAVTFQQGLLKSTDSGQTWQAINQGLALGGSQVEALVHGAKPGSVYAMEVLRLYKSLDGGRSWASMSRPGEGLIHALHPDPQDSKLLLAGTSEGLYRSADGGATWARVDRFHGSWSLYFSPLLSDPASPTVIYAAVSEEIIGTPPLFFGYLYKSLDRGVTWNVVAEGFFSSLQIVPGNPSSLYAIRDGGIARSTDGGAHWSFVARAPGVELPWALLVDPLHPSTLVAQTESDIWRSDDSGAAWRSWSDGLRNVDVTALAIDPSMPQRVYVTTRGGGLSWRAFSDLALCVAGSTRLCLNGGRFAAEVTWKDFDGNTGPGRSRELGNDSGSFWFFGSDNVELVVKILDARTFNGKFWVFYGSLTNVEFTLTVTDTQTGRVRTYHNPSGTFASAGDTAAF